MSDLSNEEKKYLMNAIWESLTKPRWTSESLIAFGKAIHSKTTLKEMDDNTFQQVFPRLKEILEQLQGKLTKWASQKEPTSSEASSEIEEKT